MAKGSRRKPVAEPQNITLINDLASCTSVNAISIRCKSMNNNFEITDVIYLIAETNYQLVQTLTLHIFFLMDKTSLKQVYYDDLKKNKANRKLVYLKEINKFYQVMMHIVWQVS